MYAHVYVSTCLIDTYKISGRIDKKIVNVTLGEWEWPLWERENFAFYSFIHLP